MFQSGVLDNILSLGGQSHLEIVRMNQIFLQDCIPWTLSLVICLNMPVRSLVLPGQNHISQRNRILKFEIEIEMTTTLLLNNSKYKRYLS